MLSPSASLRSSCVFRGRPAWTRGDSCAWIRGDSCNEAADLSARQEVALGVLRISRVRSVPPYGGAGPISGPMPASGPRPHRPTSNTTRGVGHRSRYHQQQNGMTIPSQTSQQSHQHIAYWHHHPNHTTTIINPLTQHAIITIVLHVAITPG